MAAARCSVVRDWIAFWIFGMANNFAYIVMLSAAEDIMKHETNTTGTLPANAEQCQARENREPPMHHAVARPRPCLADIIPCLLMKFLYPCFAHRISMTIRHVTTCLLQAASFVVVAFAPNVTVALIGVGIGSVQSGLGESLYLGLSAYYSRQVGRPVAIDYSQSVAAWSSGTGGAGIFGSLVYAGLTEPHFAALSPRVTLLILLLVPLVFLLTYFFVLTPVDHVYRPARSVSIPQIASEEVADFSSGFAQCAQQALHFDREAGRTDTPKVPTTAWEMAKATVPLLKYMIPMTLIYWAEYLINQGVVSFIIFDCAHGFWLYQVMYQVVNLVFFAFDAVFRFVPHIWIVFALILIEGLFGGASYVNTFHSIHVKFHPALIEFSMGMATLSDSLGIVLAGFTAMPVHNWLCKLVA
ncbi:Battenin [Aphelenchoides fujianensis]|nr:Battenin [Aphelenchoides fujianensis]